jgi:hypothetical protein
VSQLREGIGGADGTRTRGLLEAASRPNTCRERESE